MLSIYLSASIGEREQMKLYHTQLKRLGVECTSNWVYVEKDDTQADPKESAIWAVKDLHDIDHSDVLVYFDGEKVSRGKNIELGYAFADENILIVQIGKKEGSVFYHHPRVITISTWEQFLTKLKYFFGEYPDHPCIDCLAGILNEPVS